MIQKVFIPIVVKVYIGMGIILYTVQKIKLAIRKMRMGEQAALQN
ncbi:MAG: hypothetical protein P4L41_00750 [Flavipsychrobacter sp.]|nr:hypothetical protein [Flavipsychrobacter sp.]